MDIFYVVFFWGHRFRYLSGEPIVSELAGFPGLAFNTSCTEMVSCVISAADVTKIFHVDSIARAINVPNAQANQQGLATVNPIFTWVRLAQRIPVRIHIDDVPEGVVLAAGMTATLQIDPRPKP
jgi:hypothetical protein